MSAWICTPAHVAAVVMYLAGEQRAYLPMEARDMPPEAIASMLYAENVRSVNHRYPHHTPEEPLALTWAEVSRAPRLSAVECVKACHCLAYQSCEHPEWKESLAKRVLAAIESYAVSRIPGYDAAPWGIEPDFVSAGVAS